MSRSPSVLQTSREDFLSNWRSLVLTDAAFKLLAFVALTPLAGLLFRVLIAASGSAVLSDVDIVKYFLGPSGWCCAVIIGAVALGIAAMEQAALMGIIFAGRQGNRQLRVIESLQFAAYHARALLHVAAKVTGISLLVAAPFLAATAATYFALLGEFDINYYLKERPPAFLAAAGIGLVLLAGLSGTLLRLYSGWAFALPLVLFEGTRPAEALKLSCQRARGHRLRVLCWIVAWLLATMALSALATTVVGLVARSLVPHATGSLYLLSVAIGCSLLVWALLILAVNLLSTIAAATLLFNVYCRLGGGDAAAQPALDAAADARKLRLRITRARLAAAGIAGAIAALATGALAVHTVRLNDNIKIMAHRGASTEAPENTMAAIKKAIEVGADYVEIDVQETADGEVVVFHDSDLMKLAGNELRIWDATLEDLNDIDIGSWFDNKFHEERVPTLAQVLDACKGKIKVNIELKYYGHDDQLEARVADIVDSRDMGSDVVLMSLNAGQVKKLQKLRPDWRVGRVMSVMAGSLKKVEADFLAVNASFVTRDLVRRSHRHGLEVYVWTVNDAAGLSKMISRGVDGVLTDEAALALSVVEQRAKMSAPQRLLLELAELLGVPNKVAEQ